MNQLTWKLILPLTVFSFIVFTKWWYVLPDDAPDAMMIGFPLPYACDGWGTSMSLQIFICELLIDLSVYFICWYILFFPLEKIWGNIKIHKTITILLLGVSGICIVLNSLIALHKDNRIYLKRPFGIEILETGYKFIWNGNTRPENFDFEEYKRRKKERIAYTTIKDRILSKPA